MFKMRWLMKTVVLALVLAACAARSGIRPEEKIPVLLDTDANNELDDQHAIAYLLFSGDRFDVEGITVNRTSSGGDIEAQLAEALRVVKLSGMLGQVPVLKGADGSFTDIAPHVHAAAFDGSDAVQFIIERAHAVRDRPLVLLPVGKLTNIALALKKDPSIATKVRIVWLGSNYPDPGEHNQVNDEPALQYVLDSSAPFEIALVRYGKPSGTDAVRVTREEVRARMAGKGPRLDEPVAGRHGGSFTTFGDYSIDLFDHIELHGNPPSRALFDMAAAAIVKNPSWAAPRVIPAPQLIDRKWVERPKNTRTITLWENFARDEIMADFYRVMEDPRLARQSPAGRRIAAASTYSVVEIPFVGPAFSATDTPAKDVDFRVTFRHESGSPVYQVHGFWDGGDRFKVRFTPSRPGRWTLTEVHSNRRELHDQLEGSHVLAAASALRGFWEVDADSPGRRWYRRSDGSHAYIVGNTLYSFLSETYLKGRPNGSSIRADVRRSAEFFTKIRFSAIGDLYPHPTAAPFLDEAGRGTYSGEHSHRPDPEWFRTRADVAVRTALEHDLVADLIMSGVDTKEARSALQPSRNDKDPEPFLKYLAARFGSYPNVWLTLINEYDIRDPQYTPDQIVAFARTLRKYLPYATPLSVHRNAGPWLPALNTTPSWNDHVIIQQKLRDLSDSADAIIAAHAAGGADKPVVNDELSYEGAGDRHSREDTIESHVGAFLGGGFATTGYKSGNKLGQYFAGRVDPAEHTSAESLNWLRRKVDEHVSFWKMAPVPLSRSIFTGAHREFRALQWPAHEYVLGTDARHENIAAQLPAGTWEVRLLDVVNRQEKVLASKVRGRFSFDAPDTRAALVHFKRIAN